MPPSIDVILERLDGISDDISNLRQTVLQQNGRIGKIEIERAREEGARDAVAAAAANTAAALERATNLKDKSRTWKATVIVSAATALGVVVTLGTLVAHAVIYHAL